MLDSAIQEFLETKGKTLDDFLEKARKEAIRLNLSTHVAKFSHPDADTYIPRVVSKNDVGEDGNTLCSPSIAPTYLVDRCSDGFLRTGNLPAQFDIIVSANYLATENFFRLVLEDNKTILEHLEQDTDYIRNQFSRSTHSYNQLRNDLLAFKLNTSQPKTYDSVKQVYFPTDPEREIYHLLSVLMPSGILYELKNRINAMHFSEQAKASREARKKNKAASDYSELYDLLSIRFGGANPQNISASNTKNNGVSYLLPASPPVLKRRRINPPRNSFFDLSYTKPGYYQDLFEELHQTLSLAINNKAIRNKIKTRVKAIFFAVIDRSWEIRYLEAGWSDSERYIHLPKAQKLWLDQQYRQSADKDEYWLQTIQNGLIRWFDHAYRQVLKDKAYPLSDYEFIELGKWLEECGEGLK